MSNTVKWHRCDEVTPPSRTRVLTYDPTQLGSHRITIGAWDCKDHGKGNMVWGWYMSKKGNWMSNPTHWALLPDAPETEE